MTSRQNTQPHSRTTPHSPPRQSSWVKSISIMWGPGVPPRNCGCSIAFCWRWCCCKPCCLRAPALAAPPPADTPADALPPAPAGPAAGVKLMALATRSLLPTAGEAGGVWPPPAPAAAPVLLGLKTVFLVLLNSFVTPLLLLPGEPPVAQGSAAPGPAPAAARAAAPLAAGRAGVLKPLPSALCSTAAAPARCCCDTGGCGCL